MKKSYDITVTGLYNPNADIVAKPRTENARAWFDSLWGSEVVGVKLTRSEFDKLTLAAGRQKLRVQQH